MAFSEILLSTFALSWLAGSIFLLIWLRILQPAPLAGAPPRHTQMILPYFFGALALYFVLLSAVVIFAGLTQGPAGGTPPTKAATGPAAVTQSGSMPGTVSGTTASTESDDASGINTAIELQSLSLGLELVIAFAIVVGARHLSVGRIDGLGLSLRKIPSGVAYGLLGLFIVYPFLVIINSATEYVVEYFGKKGITVHETLQMLEKPLTLGQQAFFILTAAVFAPIAEEIVCRGLLQTALIQPAFGLLVGAPTPATFRPSVKQRWMAIVITSLFFAAIHGTPDYLALLFVLSLALGYVYDRTGNLWASIVLHASFNALVTTQFMFFRG